MQWDAGLNAGFSQGTPWLPVEANYKTYSVESEKKDPDSMHSWYAGLLKLRHNNPVFRDGAYLPLESGNPNVFAFARKAGADQIALIVLNTSAVPQKVRITGLPGKWPHFRHVLMASPQADAPTSQKLSIAPYGVLIASVE